MACKKSNGFTAMISGDSNSSINGADITNAEFISDALITALAGRRTEEGISTFRRRIAANKSWLKLALGKAFYPRVIPQELTDRLVEFLDGTGFASLEDSELPENILRLRSHAFLFFKIRGRFPCEHELNALLDASELNRLERQS